MSTIASTAVPVSERGDVVLPARDVRTALDDRARRGWTETTRRVGRVMVLLGSDTIAGVLAVFLARLTWNLVAAGGRRPLPNLVPLVAMVLCIQPLALRVCGAYAAGKARTNLGRLAGGVLIAVFLGWVQARLFGQASPDLPNKTAYLYSGALIIAVAYIGRLVLDRMIRQGYRSGVLRRRVLLIGGAIDAADLERECRERPDADIAIVGRLATPARDTGAESEAAEFRAPYLGTLTALEDAIARSRPQSVIIVSSMPPPLLEDVVQRCFLARVSVSLLPVVLRHLSGAQFAVRRGAVGSFLELIPFRFDIPQLAIKRTMDVGLTLIGLILTAPLLAIIAVAIKLDSPGPVLFRQVRAGMGGRPFHILKFRTMTVGADQQKEQLQYLNEYPDPRLFKIRRDPRVTRLGRLLRRTSLDELPQMWNVLRGDMSLVGPRPCVPEELRHYAAHHLQRLHVIPGVTGPWQVNGRNQIKDFEEVVRLETEYIRNWSVVTDLRILLKTIPAAFSRGAY